jgi:hypothetical protein
MVADLPIRLSWDILASSAFSRCFMVWSGRVAA